MTTIKITMLDATLFEVHVEGRSPTTHQVNVPTAYAEKLTEGAYSTSALVEASFEFLLERESNTSILRRFELSVIGHYFPEYEKKIGEYLKRG